MICATKECEESDVSRSENPINLAFYKEMPLKYYIRDCVKNMLLFLIYIDIHMVNYSNSQKEL